MKRYHFYIQGFFILFFSLFFSYQVQAKDSETFIVDTPSLTVRSEPAVNAEAIGYLQAGDTVAVFGTKFGWARSFFDEQEGWVAPQYLNPAYIENMNLEEKPEKVTIATEGARIRSGPGTDYAISFIAHQDEQYELVSTENEWLEIALEKGSTGWVASQLTNTNTVSNEEQKKEKLPLTGYTIVLDAGHGGRDPGAIALDNTYEKNLALITVQKTAELLKKTGATVILTREDDIKVPLDERVKISNEIFADAFISFHYNSEITGTMRGTNTFFYQNKASRKLAESLQSSIAELIPLQNNGIREATFRVLKNNQNPSALVELGFLSNSEDLAAIHAEGFQTSAAGAITDGLIAYFEQK